MTRPSGERVLSLIRLNPNKFGTYEEFEIGLTNRCRLAGIESVKVFTGLPPAEIVRKFEAAGAVMETYPELCSRTGSYRRLRQLVRKYRPDVLHISFFPFLTELILWGRLLGVPSILFTDHASGAPSRKKWIKKETHRVAVKTCASQLNLIISVSDFVRRRMIGLGVPSDRVRLIYNGVNTERFVPLNQEMSDSSEKTKRMRNEPVFTIVANLFADKGCLHFIEAAQIFQTRGWPGRFLVVGTGPERDLYETRVREMDLSDRMKFLGIRSDVESILRNESDIFVCPSLWEEAFGLGNIEAMASGLPVVAYGTGAIPEVVVDGKTGILVERERSDLLAEAMHRLGEDPGLCHRMGEKGRSRVKEMFQLSRQVEETFQVYEHHLSGRSRN